jgi:FAD/FMN-containing dehydrogenase
LIFNGVTVISGPIRNKKDATTLNQKNLVTDVTNLNGTRVFAEVTPAGIYDVVRALTSFDGPVSIGGGRFSMGGQIASEGSLHLDMRNLANIDEPKFNNGIHTIFVQAGATWKDVQRRIDPHDLSVSIMQTYSNFTVGGSLSVNVHGRYVGQGALIHSVQSIMLVLADGTLKTASRTENPELFFGAIGGYGGIGVIVGATLILAKNTKVERSSKVMPLEDYLHYFQTEVASKADQVVFHNGNLCPPHYSTVRAISWSQTDKPVTQPARLYEKRKLYPLHKYAMWSVSELPFGKWRREHIIEPLLDRKPAVHWRNYEAGYDVAELEPVTRSYRTYVLQEYFVPVAHCAAFVKRMGDVLNQHNVNVINVSIRHAKADQESYLSWAQEEVFAFVLYYKQGVTPADQKAVGVWTRELVRLASQFGGSFYLPYQPHATREQFDVAYPRAAKLFALKDRLDPHYRFRNVIWETYYKESSATQSRNPNHQRMEITGMDGELSIANSEFREVMADKYWQDQLYLFLQNVYGLYPAASLFQLIEQQCVVYMRDEAIYRSTQERLGELTNPVRAAFMGLAALSKQKKEMAVQVHSLTGGGRARAVNSYLEIGSKGRYFKGSCNTKEVVQAQFVEEKPVGYSPLDILERGAVPITGQQYLLADYEPLQVTGRGQMDMVTCFIGLHHIAPEKLEAFVRSIADSLATGGVFILREHNVETPEMHRFVSLIHTVFNMGLKESWDTDSRELRHFRSLSYWINLLDSVGLTLESGPIYQKGDPSLNGLMMFRRRADD